MNRLARRGILVLAALALGACATHPPAPIVERSTRPPPAEIPVDGLYRVRGGDTLYGIAFRYGLDYRDIARWSGIGSPYTIFPDQVVRLKPPPARQVTTRGAATPSSRDSTPPAQKPPVPATRSAPAPATRVAPPSTATSPPMTPGDWAWPVEGRLLRTFRADDPTRNGIDIVGREGDPVRAAGAGEVVYSGNGLIGYGELVIVKHDDRMLSAYAHNRRRLVKEGDRISRGDRIAELGRNDRNETVLHFEIRRDGKPVDPLQYLPKR